MVRGPWSVVRGLWSVVRSLVVPWSRGLWSFLTLLALTFHTQAADPAGAMAPSILTDSALRAPRSAAAAAAMTNILFPGQTTTPLTILRDPKAVAAFMAALDDTKKLGPGDIVTYRVLEDQDETKALVISDTGDLDAPYLGFVQAVKKTPKQLAFDIKARLEKQSYRRATVIINLQEINKKRILGKIYVSGQVRQSGSQEIPDDEVFTVSKAILKAGGFSDFADKRKVRLIRAGIQGGTPGENTRVINIEDIWEKGKTANDVPVQADDIIFVPKKTVNF